MQSKVASARRLIFGMHNNNEFQMLKKPRFWDDNELVVKAMMIKKSG